MQPSFGKNDRAFDCSKSTGTADQSMAIVCSSIGFAVVGRFHKRIFAGFTTKEIIVIALFSTTIFVGVMVPSTLFLNLIRAVLGPISVLLTGLINETLYYALLTALLIYISGNPERDSRYADKACPPEWGEQGRYNA